MNSRDEAIWLSLMSSRPYQRAMKAYKLAIKACREHEDGEYRPGYWEDWRALHKRADEVGEELERVEARVIARIDARMKRTEYSTAATPRGRA